MENNEEQNLIKDVSDQEQIISKDELRPEYKRPIYIRTLNVFVNPLRQRYEHHYRESKKHLVIDFIFVILILILIGLNIYLFTREFPIESIEINFNHTQVNGERDVVPTSTKPEVTVTSLIFNNFAQYYSAEGEQLGVGVWPPQVGATTTLRVVWSLQTRERAVKDVNYTAQLPVGVSWNGNSVVNKGQAISYDSQNRLVSWQVENLEAGEEVRGSFEIEFVPEEKQRGGKVKLLEDIEVSAIDSLLQETVQTKGNNLYSPEVK